MGLSRSERAAIAAETVDAVQRGEYRTATGVAVRIEDAVRDCMSRTRCLSSEDSNNLRREVLSHAAESTHSAVVDVVNETTLTGIAKLMEAGNVRVGALNFASARNPGGGFLTGAQAQEESLARASALYASQMAAFPYYERHRAASSLLYSDAMIVSPDCPVFRDDDGAWLQRFRLVTFLTCAAPNAGAIAKTQPESQTSIPQVLRQRAECVLAAAAAQGVRHLVLGAWGCGVFGNSPEMVATIFGELLRGVGWGKRFQSIRFSVLDRSADLSIFRAFEKM
jgi:uncharacterized protein (TIGR02452 family)